MCGRMKPRVLPDTPGIGLVLFVLPRNQNAFKANLGRGQ